jgi:GAF domain-containing protein
MTNSISASRQQASGRRPRRGSLRIRLTVTTLLIALPLLVAMAVFLTSRARSQLEQDAKQGLRDLNNATTATVSLWLDAHSSTLKSLAASPAIQSMNAAEQKPALSAMTAAFPYIYLASTTDLTGMNVARNDNVDLKDYSDRIWFQQARQGASITYQTVIGKTGGKPALIISAPIVSPESQILGTVMFAIELENISRQVQTTHVGQKGFAFVVDNDNILVAHPAQTVDAPELSPDTVGSELIDLSAYPPVTALREGTLGSIIFKDNQGQNWYAYISKLSNGWGVIVQQPEQALLAAINDFQRIAWIVLIAGAVLLLLLVWLTVRQGLLPVRSLTETANAITDGDLTRLAPVKSNDELGLLANTFNSMTTQLRELISGLESRVAERTSDLERRAVQLQVTAEVARDAAAIHNLEQLLENIVNRISDRFGFYHAGIFFLDIPRAESGDGQEARAGYAILRAASSEGGHRMLARGHRLKVGESGRESIGIVGYAASTGQPRIALDVGQDAVFFNNPDLPLTRSEMALPLKVHDQVIGVLDVQSTEPGAFTQEDVDILQILADQVALAIDNARLFSTSQQAYQELETLYGTQVRQRWQQHLAGKPLIYAYDYSGVKPVETDASLTLAFEEMKAGDGSDTVEVPIEMRGQRLGTLVLRRRTILPGGQEAASAGESTASSMGAWTAQEKELIKEAVSQVAMALENARLFEEAQRLAMREQLIGQVSSRMRATLDIDTVLQTAVREIGRSMNIEDVEIRLGNSPRSS